MAEAALNDTIMDETAPNETAATQARAQIDSKESET